MLHTVCHTVLDKNERLYVILVPECNVPFFNFFNVEPRLTANRNRTWHRAVSVRVLSPSKQYPGLHVKSAEFALRETEPFSKSPGVEH